jgi:hypothetical protein
MKTKIIVLSVLAVVAGAGSCYWLMRSPKKAKTADFSNQTPDEIRGYLRSAEFRKLDEQTRREMAQLAFRQMQERRINDYFALPANQRTAYLDKLIDEMEVRRKERALRGNDPNSQFGFFDPNSRSNDPNARQRRRQQRQAMRTPENQRARREAIDPLTRAKMAAFRAALGARMSARGISAPGGGGRGR